MKASPFIFQTSRFCAKSLQSISNQASSSSQCLLGLPTSLFLLGLQLVNLAIHLSIPHLATCPAHLHLLRLAASTTSDTPVAPRIRSVVHLSLSVIPSIRRSIFLFCSNKFLR